MQVKVEVASAPLAAKNNDPRRRPHEQHRRWSQEERRTVGTTPIRAQTPSEPACQGRTDRSGFATAKAWPCEIGCTRLLRLASNYQIRIRPRTDNGFFGGILRAEGPRTIISDQPAQGP